MNKDNVEKLVNELNTYGTWHNVDNELPNVKEFGDGNFCRVGVYTDRGLRGRTIYGCSGAPNEPYHFGEIIETDCGEVKTKDKIVQWKYIKQKDNE